RECTDVLGARERIGTGELPAPQRRHSEHGHQLGRNYRRHDAPWLVGRPEIHRAGPVGAEVLERLIPFPELHEFRSRHPELIESETWKLARDEHKPRGILSRQGVNKDAT